MRRNLLVVALGITFLILMTWLGTIITTLVPHRVTAQVQTVQAGSYQVTLQVNPNPPLITQPATLSVQVQMQNSQQPVSNAHVTLESAMETMDMGTDHTEAHPTSNGAYQAHVQFTMSGPWQIQVHVSAPNTPVATATFEITAQ
jgi:hypothetical protein